MWYIPTILYYYMYYILKLVLVNITYLEKQISTEENKIALKLL